MIVRRSVRAGHRLILAAVTAGVLAALLAGAAPASAAMPWWRLDSTAAPTILNPGDNEDQIIVKAINLGDQSVTGKGAPIKISDTLPAGLTATAISGAIGTPGRPESDMTCELGALTCTYEGTLVPYELLQVVITVKVEEPPPGTVTNNAARVEGGQGLEGDKGRVGGTPTGVEPKAESLEQPVTVGSGPTPFGVEKVQFAAENDGGSTDTQAGDHPFQLTTNIDFTQVLEAELRDPSTAAVRARAAQRSSV